MGKKTKVGKSRKDKFYQLAKETGYRARSAFKLIQLNRKFGFLENSRVCIDLCAAPGGWCQVAAKFMPVSSIIVGVDLVPIRNIPNVTTIVDDITTESCRSKLKKHLQTWKADCVINDGAPNVGQAWAQDAFSQAQLTLHAFKLACEFLKEGGIFVTKVFRSKDYQPLMWVFQQLFKKVTATKPQASRNESAEIFVVCQHFLAPEKVDPKFFSYKSVFAEVAKDAISNNNQKLNLINPAKKSRKRDGYADDATLSLHKTVSAREFIDSPDFLDLLSIAYTIEVKDDKLKDSKHTTDDILEHLKDVKVLGKKEIRAVIKWRERIIKEENPDQGKEEDKEEEMEVQEEEDEKTKIEHQILELEASEKVAARHKKKKQSKLKEKNLSKVARNLDVPKAAFGADEDPCLFNLNNIKSKKHLNGVEETEISAGEEDDEEELEFETSDEEEDSENEGEESGAEIDSASEEEDDDVKDDEEEEENPLVVKESKEKVDKTKLWFSKLKEKLAEEDEEENEDREVGAMANALGVATTDKKKVTFEVPAEAPKEEKTPGEKKEGEKDDDESETDTEDESDDEDYRELRKKRKKVPGDDKEDLEVVPAIKKQKALTAAELALGQKIVTSRKAKNDLIDEGYHRYAFGDEENIPDWFEEEEKKYYKKAMPVTKEEVEEYKQQIREINARPIKKIAEAKAKQKYKAMKKLKKLAEAADLITDNTDGQQAEQVHKLRQMMKKNALAKKKQETTYVKAKRMHGKHQKRPADAKGRVKYVDSRMKKDVDGMKRAEAKKKGQTKTKSRNRVGHKPRSR